MRKSLFQTIVLDVHADNKQRDWKSYSFGDSYDADDEIADDDVIVMIELLSWPVGEPPSISLDHFGPTSSLSLNQNRYHHSYHSLRTIMLVSAKIWLPNH